MFHIFEAIVTGIFLIYISDNLLLICRNIIYVLYVALIFSTLLNLLIGFNSFLIDSIRFSTQLCFLRIIFNQGFCIISLLFFLFFFFFFGLLYCLRHQSMLNQSGEVVLVKKIKTNKH